MIDELLKIRDQRVTELDKINEDIEKLIFSVCQEIGLSFHLFITDAYLNIDDDNENGPNLNDQLNILKLALKENRPYISVALRTEEGFIGDRRMYLRIGDNNFSFHYGEIPVALLCSKNVKLDIVVAQQAYETWKEEKTSRAIKEKLLTKISKEEKNKIREVAKAKLTPEEREALGLR